VVSRFEKRIEVNGLEIDVMILDTAGQESFTALRSGWIVGRDAFILGFDASNINLDALLEYRFADRGTTR